MTSTGIKTVLTDYGVPTDVRSSFEDENFRLPQLDWIRDTFIPNWIETLRALDITYVPERSDCDDFANFCAAYARILNARSTTVKASIAWGFYALTLPDGGRHAINVIFTTEDQYTPIPLLFEPQPPCNIWTPRKFSSEWQSCLRYRF